MLPAADTLSNGRGHGAADWLRIGPFWLAWPDLHRLPPWTWYALPIGLVALVYLKGALGLSDPGTCNGDDAVPVVPQTLAVAAALIGPCHPLSELASPQISRYMDRESQVQFVRKVLPQVPRRYWQISKLSSEDRQRLLDRTLEIEDEAASVAAMRRMTGETFQMLDAIEAET